MVAIIELPRHAGELLCASESRCGNYIDAGDRSLAALSSVSACRTFCNRTFPRVPLFAFHNEAGMTQFMDHPKGRCRCYDSMPCELVPDSGYSLWSTGDKCVGLQRAAAVAVAAAAPPVAPQNRTQQQSKLSLLLQQGLVGVKPKAGGGRGGS